MLLVKVEAFSIGISTLLVSGKRRIIERKSEWLAFFATRNRPLKFCLSVVYLKSHPCHKIVPESVIYLPSH